MTDRVETHYSDQNLITEDNDLVNLPDTTASPDNQTGSATATTIPSPPSIPLKTITHNGMVERSISTSCWVQNLVGDGAASKKREAHVSFFPLQSTVTYDTENITPDEAVVFLKQRPTADEKDAADSIAHRTCVNYDTSAVTSIRAAAEIVNSLATSSFLQYSMYSYRNLIPLFMANSRQGEFGGKYMRYSSIRDCFSRGSVVDGLLKDLRKRKVNAAKAFITAVRKKSVVNTALAAWNAGNAANLEKLVDFCRNKYGPDRGYNAAGIHRAAAPASGKAGGSSAPTTFTSEEFLEEIKRRHKGSLTFDSAPTVFNDALSRVFREFKAAVDSRDASSPLFAAVRQNYRGAKDECMPNLGMMAPRERHSVAEYMLADKNSDKLDYKITKISTDIENIRGGRKRKAAAEDLNDTLAASVSKSAVDASDIGTAAVTSSENYEWSLHITQLFAQAFLESMASLLSCVFDVSRPFTVDWFETIESMISKQTMERVVDMDPTVLANQYLLLTGNFQIPFHVSEHDDIVCGRQVVPNTPLLTLVTRFLTSDNRVVTEIDFRDRLLVSDVELNKSADNLSATDAAQLNTPSAYGEDKKPVMQGCLPVIRGPIAFKRKEANNGADDTINGLANDWYVSVGVYYAMGKSTAAIAAGQQRALASAKSLLTSSKSPKGFLRGISDEKRLKRSMRENADSAMRTLELLGQGISEWGHSEHNSTLDTFWSSAAAARSKATQDALNSAELLSMRRQMDGKCTPGTATVDEFLVAEQLLRDSFFRAVSRTTSTGVDDMVLLPDSMSMYKDVFSDESSSGLVQTWKQYAAAISHLTDYERSAFNVKGLFSAINRFRFPLVPEGKYNSKHRRYNLKAANAIVNGLTEMTLQTAVNGTSIGELGFGLGSAQDGWGGYTNCIQPSRMHALKAMSKIGANPNVISIPVSRSLSGRGDVASIDIPAVILSYLISDKRTLDDLCGANTNLCTEINKFVNNLAGVNSQDKSPIFTVGKYSIIFLRYIWFNTAVISLTDVNIKTALDFLGRDMGSSLYRDFLAIRRLINTYNADLSDISVQAVADRYNCESKGATRGSGNVTIKTETELSNVLKQISNALNAFTEQKNGIPASASNMTKSITSVNDIDAVKNAKVVVDITAEQIKQFWGMAEFIYDIYAFNLKTEVLLRRYALGKGLSKSEIENMSHPNITAIFKRELGIHGTALNSPMADTRTVKIDLNNDFPLINKANIGFATERLMKLQSKHDKDKDDITTAEIEVLTMELANTGKLENLVGTIKTPKGITADAAINIVNAFTRDGRFSNRNTHLNILAGALVRMKAKMSKESDVGGVTMIVDDVSTFVRDGLLTCLIAAHSTAGRCLLNPVIRDIAKFLRDLVAETSLVVSRLQNAFFPIHPAALSLGALFKPDRKAFDDMTREYVSEIVKQMTDATTRDMSELCNDTSNRMFKAGEMYSKGVLNPAAQAITSTSSSIADNLQNPAKVWSVSALPHFDMAVVPKSHPDVSSDQLFRLSTYYQGMHKLSLNSDCAPDRWDSTLAGNQARDFFGLRSFSDNNRSFNLALDTVLASPAELCDLVSREMVRASNDVVHNIGSMSNVAKVNMLLDKGASAVEKFSASAPSTEESRIRDTVLSLTKSGASTNEGLLTAREIVKTWNISSLLNNNNNNRKMKSLSSGRDVVKAPLEAVPFFRQNVVEATRSLYELAAVCSVMSKNETARTSSLKIMGTLEETSPVMFDIGVSRIAGLVSTVTSNKQQKKLLQTVSDYRNSLVRFVNVNPLSAASSAGSAASSALSSGLKAVYDGMLSSSAVHGSTPASSQTVSLPDRFWMDVFSECLEAGGASFAEQRRSSPLAKLYGSRFNTYAALSTNIDRRKTSMASVDKERRRKIEQNVAKIEEYVSHVLTDDTMTKMVDAQKTYNKLADVTANSVHTDFSNDILKTAVSKTKTARQHSDAILAAMLHELASMVYDTHPDLGTQFSLAGHILTAKGVCRELTNTQTQDIFDNLLSVAGVSDFYHVSANTLCSRLKDSDIKLFLGGTLLQQGLFLSFLLNNVLFYQISEDLKMAELSSATKSLLVKLVGFCGTVNDAMSTRYVSASCIHRQRCVAADAEETKLDVSFITSLFSAYRDLRRKTELYRESEIVAQIFGRMSAGDYSSASASKAVMVSKSAKGPHPKRNSRLEDVLRAPSTVHKTFLVSYPEKAAATRKVKRAGGAVLFNNSMEVVYGSDVLNDMRNSSSDYLMQDFCDYDIDMLDEDYEDEFGESYLSSSSDVSDYSNCGDEDDDDHHYSYDALDRLNAVDRPLTHIYGCGDDDEDGYEDERSRRGNTQLNAILRDIGESDDDFDEYDENYVTDRGLPGMVAENIARRRSERLQYGVGFLSHSFIMDHPAKARAFLTRGKRFKRNPGTVHYLTADDDAAIFSDESSSSSSSSSYSDDEFGSGSNLLHRFRRAKIYKRRSNEKQFSFISRVTRSFVPTRTTLVDGRVSMVTPVSSETASGFFENYQKANKKERENLRKQYNIDTTKETSLPQGSDSANPRHLRRSLIKAAAYVYKTQENNAETFFQAIIKPGMQTVPDPTATLSETVLFSKDLKAVIDTRNKLMKNLSEVSCSLFISSATSVGRDEEILREALDSVSDGDENRSGYLGIPLRNLSRCIKASKEADNTDTFTVDQLLAVTDKNHLDWMTIAGIAFARAFNVTTPYALDSTLKTTASLNDMYNAFTSLLSTQQEEHIKVNSTLLDSIFNTRMAHTEAVMGLVYPTAFINHEMPHDPVQRRNLQALSLNVIRGVNSKQLPRNDIGDTSGLLAFITSSKFAGRGGERGGLSLYRMSITDALNCDHADRRLKGAVSLEVGKWKMMENSVFSKRSADLVAFCSKNNLTLENAVGPIARFVPNGTSPANIGMNYQLSLYVSDDTAALRLQSAEEGCGAAGRFITASAAGNLFGKIEEITTLANKFAAVYDMLDYSEDGYNATEITKEIISKMKAKRNKALKTPFGNTVTAQVANFPSLSDSIVMRAREIRHSIASIVTDLSKRYGIFSGPSRTTNSVIPIRVSVSAFKRILETSAVLAKTKMSLRGIENRLAAAYTNLKQFKHIVNDGLSGPKAVFLAIAKTLNTLNFKNDGTEISADNLLKQDGILSFVVDIELKNIEDAKNQVTAAIEGTCSLHAKTLSVLAAFADFNSSSLDRNSVECQRLSDKVSGGNFEPMTNTQCGTIIKHKGTGVWLKTDEECNTKKIGAGGVGGGAMNDHRRIAQTIMSIVESNRNGAIISTLQSMCVGKYAVNDIFVVDDSDAKSVDRMIEKLGEAIAEKASSPSSSSSSSAASSPYSSSLVGVSTAVSEGSDSSSAPKTECLGKTIPYIPIIFENKQKSAGERSTDANASASTSAAEQKAAAMRQLEIQESNDLSNILAVASKHKFATHNQAAIVDIFNGRQNAELVIPEKMLDSEYKKTYKGILSRLPTSVSVAIQADISSGSSVQFPPNAMESSSSSSSSSSSVSERLKGYATKLASTLHNAPEYKDLNEAQRKISAAIKHAITVENASFFNGGARPEIKQTVMSTLSQSQSAKEGALELLEKVLTSLENYTPDPSLASMSVPVNSSSLSNSRGKSSSSSDNTDYFHATFEKLNSASLSEDGTDAIVNNAVEQDAAIRVPLLLSSPGFASDLRALVENMDEYYKRMDKIRVQIASDAKHAVADAVRATSLEIGADKKSMIPTIDNLRDVYSNEADDIKTAIKVLENKNSELELQNNRTASIIDNITGRIEAGDITANANDMLDYGNKADNDQQFLQNLKKFANDNSGPVYTPPASRDTADTSTNNGNTSLTVRDSYRNLMRDAIASIKQGQEGVIVSFDSAIDAFPTPSTEYGKLTMQTAEQKQRDRFTSVELYMGIVVERINKLRARLAQSAKESGEVDAKKEKIDSVFRRQVEDRNDDIKKNVSISETAAVNALSKDIMQSPLMISLSGKVDKLLMRSERLGVVTLSSSSNPLSSSEAPKTVKESDAKSRVEHVIADSSNNSCFLHPLHDSIRRISSMFSISKKGPLANSHGVSTSEADLQLMTIFDLSGAVLRSTSAGGGGAKNPELVPSSIVPGLCQQCAMMVTNLHEASHESSHAFTFESKRSRQKLLDMLSAVTSESDDARTRSNVLAMLDSNNGHIKEFGFTQKQKVACLTPVNTLFGGTFSGDVAPNTVILPTSELFSCPGVENDKFRSMAHRSIDKNVADASKRAASIVETLARTAPNAENLFFPFKDQRRHFNSITDAIISGMSSEASSQLNTTCDQNLVQVDDATGFPVFVGRRGGMTRVTETDVTAAAASHIGGLPVCTKDRQKYVDMGATFMVAPGSLLNANKEENLRLNRLSDINNVRHNGTDVHVAGANSAWRINEVIKAASSCTEWETNIRKALLLGSVSGVSAQKLAQNSNDPTAMINTSAAVQNLVNEAFPSPSALVNHVEATQSAFSTQLAYRQRLFPHITNNCLRDGASHMEQIARPLDILFRTRRYNDAYRSLHSQPASNTPNNDKRFQPCEMLKQSVSNVSLSNTVYGAFEEAMNNNSISSNDDSTNKLAVQAMTDTTIDTFSAMSSVVGRQSPYKLPSSVLNLAMFGRPSSDRKRNDLLSMFARISRDASLLSNIDTDSAGLSYFSSFLRSSSSPLNSSSTQPSSDISNAAERVLGSILDSAEETNNRLTRLGVHGPWGAGRPEAQALHRNAMTSILQMNEDEIARDMNDIESRIETRQLREAFQELKRSMLISSSSNNSSSAPMSLLMPRSYAASGMVSRGLSTSTLAVNTVDNFNTTPLLVRYILLDSGKSPLPLAKEVKNILTQPKAVTARALLSESSPLLTELCLYNTRDTPPERAIDRLVVSAYLVKHAKRLDGVDTFFPAALTCTSHLMLSSMDSSCNNSHYLNNIKLHMNDTTSFLKNIERSETVLGRFGDTYAMSHRQNCNCPFALHHTFTPSDDEHLTPSFAFARPEITTEEIRAIPYQANKLLNDKHYVMNMTKIDTRVTGSALIKKISEWTEMHMNVGGFNGAFEPSKLALSNSGMTTAGVNLNVIVNPNNAKNVMGILECHRQHVCSVDAKSTIAAAMPAIFQATDNSGNASDLVQNALPHNRYIQKSTMNAHTIIFTNVLEQLITDLGKVIVNELAGELASSVPKTVHDNTQDMINHLGTDSLFASSSAMAESASEGNEGNDSNPRLVSDAMKNAIYHTLIFGKAADPENVPFASTAAGPLAYDFLLSKDETVTETNTVQAAAHAVASTASSVLRKHLARVFEAISRQISDSEFGNIVDDIEANIFDESLSPSSSSSCPPHQRSSSDKFTFAIRREFNKIISFLTILRNNITPALLNPNGALAEKMAIYLSLLSAKSKLENFFQYGLSNSSSVDLSHLKPVNCSNGVKNIEDTFMYRNVHPVLIMALPENFTALLQQEQNDPEHAIENRRALTTFLGHPNTASMATGARSVMGAGGGNPVGLYVSSHILHESTVATADPVLDEQTNLSFHSPVTQDPVMVVNPFKDSARLAVSSSSEASSILNGNACSYLQVSMPTESSGLITNTGYTAASASSKDDKFRYIRRDNTPVYLPKVTPTVLCSDASTNLLDVFSRANVTLEDVNVRFGFMPEIITAVATMRGISKAEAIKDMAAKCAINNSISSSSNENAFVDAKTGDIVIRKGVFPDTRILHDAEKAKWGEDGTQKLHARALPVFLLNNPLAAAAVNGIPVTLNGLSLVEEKRKKAAGIVSSSSPSMRGGLGDGCIGTGALRAAANSRLVSDLEPLREGWENIIRLQNIFSKAASELKRQMSGNTRITPETQRVVNKIHANFKVMADCREILQNQVAILVATSDLITGGYAGDPSVAMVAPVHPETTGLIGAISSPIKGLGHLLKREGVAGVTASIRQKLHLTTSNGRTLPEHGVVHKSSQELLTDADSIQNMYDNFLSKTTCTSSDEDGNLGKIMASLGLKGTKSGDVVYATKYIGNLLASPEYGNRHDLRKRQSILQLLVANPDLLNNVANALFINNGKNSISPLTTTDTACRILGTHNNSSSNNVQTLNRLFGSRLS